LTGFCRRSGLLNPLIYPIFTLNRVTIWHRMKKYGIDVRRLITP
jgi:hypothetical protein